MFVVKININKKILCEDLFESSVKLVFAEVHTLFLVMHPCFKAKFTIFLDVILIYAHQPIPLIVKAWGKTSATHIIPQSSPYDSTDTKIDRDIENKFRESSQLTGLNVILPWTILRKKNLFKNWRTLMKLKIHLKQKFLIKQTNYLTEENRMEKLLLSPLTYNGKQVLKIITLAA